MFKKTITYTDYNGEERTEDFYFHLNKAEAMKMELSVNGGFSAQMRKYLATKDMASLTKTFDNFILMSYGEKSNDGKRFIKNEELTKAFTETEAYSNLFMELATNPDMAAAFLNGIIPQDIVEEAKNQQKLSTVEEAKKNANVASLT